jgi:hypothetical protein
MIFREFPLLNSHSFLEPSKKIEETDICHATITPKIIQSIIQHISPIYYTDSFEWLLDIPYEHTVGEYHTSHFYVIMEDYSMIQLLKDPNRISIHDWIQCYWNKPFLVTHPYYKKINTEKILQFSSKYATSFSLENTVSLHQQSIDNGSFSIGNGLIIALSMVSLGIWKEEEVLMELDMLLEMIQPIDKGLCLYTLLNTKWDSYISQFPYQIIDHVFKYAFQYNSENIYRYIYQLTKEDFILYHVSIDYSPVMYVTTPFYTIKTKGQYYFLIEHLSRLMESILLTYTHNHKIQWNYYQIVLNIIRNSSLWKLFLENKNIFYETIGNVEVSKKLIPIIEACCKLYRHSSKPKKRRLMCMYHILSDHYKTDWLQAFKYLILKKILLQNASIFLPIKLVRNTIFTLQEYLDYHTVQEEIIYTRFHLENIPFVYDLLKTYEDSEKKIRMYVSWKNLFQELDKLHNTHRYTAIFQKRIQHTLQNIKLLTKDSEDAYLLYTLMTEYYRDRKELLWKRSI